MDRSDHWLVVAGLVYVLGTTQRGFGILAGDETALPADSPAARLDTLGSSSLFNAVGSLSINAGGFSYIGSATAISPNWILTAGHNLDLNDNGAPDPSLSIHFIRRDRAHAPKANWHYGLEFRLQAVRRTDTRLPPEGGTPNGACARLRPTSS